MKKIAKNELEQIQKRAESLADGKTYSTRMNEKIIAMAANELPESGKFGELRFIENKENSQMNHFVIDALNSKGEKVGQISLSTLLGFGLDSDKPIRFKTSRGATKMSVLSGVTPVNPDISAIGAENDLTPLQLGTYLENKEFSAVAIEKRTFFPIDKRTAEELNELSDINKESLVNVKKFYKVSLK